MERYSVSCCWLPSFNIVFSNLICVITGISTSGPQYPWVSHPHSQLTGLKMGGKKSRKFQKPEFDFLHAAIYTAFTIYLQLFM